MKRIDVRVVDTCKVRVCVIHLAHAICTVDIAIFTKYTIVCSLPKALQYPLMRMGPIMRHEINPFHHG